MSIRNRDWSRRPNRDQRPMGIAVVVPVSDADDPKQWIGGLPHGMPVPTRFVAKVPGTAQVSGAVNRTK